MIWHKPKQKREVATTVLEVSAQGFWRDFVCMHYTILRLRDDRTIRVWCNAWVKTNISSCFHHIRFYTLSLAYAPFTTNFDYHSSRYYTPRLPTFRLRTFGHPHLRCYTLLFLHKAIVHNAFTTQPIHHIPFLHNSLVHVSSVDTTRTTILRE